MSLMNRLPWRREREERTESREEPTSIDLFRDMNRMFDEFFTRGFGLSPLWSEEGWASFSPSIDVVETDDAIRVSAELPGLEEKDIELRLDNNMLTIRGEKKHEHEERDAHTYRTERTYGAFQRTVALPTEVKAEDAEAVYRNGVLTITLPKSGDVVSKKIKVKQG